VSGSRSLTFVLDLAIADSRAFASQLERLGHKRAEGAASLYQRLVAVQQKVLAMKREDDVKALAQGLRRLAEGCVEELTPLAELLDEAARIAARGNAQ